MNLGNLGVQEIGVKEMKQIDGGHWLVDLLVDVAKEILKEALPDNQF